MTSSTRTEDAVLVVSTGCSDLKRWHVSSDDPPNPVTRPLEPPDNETMRSLHESLLAGARTWNVLAREELLSAIGAGSANELPSSTGGDTSAEYILWPAKIAPVVTELRSAQENGGKRKIRRVIVLYTDREKPGPDDLPGLQRKYDDEPCATGHILATWLGEQFDLKLRGEFEGQPAKDGVYLLNCLKGRKLLEGESPIDLPLHTQIVQRIDSAVSALAVGLQVPRAYVLDTGGMGPIKDCMRACVDLRYQRRARHAGLSEYGPGGRRRELAWERSHVSHVLGLQVRARVESRLWEGDFGGAWGVAADIRDSRHNASWLGSLGNLREVFLGGRPDSVDPQSALSTLCASPVSQLLLCGFRIEAALQAARAEDRRVLEALALLRTFCDLALLYSIGAALQERDDVAGFDARSRAIEFCSGDIPNAFREEPRFDKKDRRLPDFSMVVERRGRFVLNSRADSQWRKWLQKQNRVAALNIMVRFCDAPATGGSNLKDYRNEQTHRFLTHADLAGIEQAASFDHKKYGPMWRQIDHQYDPKRLGRCFLATEAVTTVYKEFNIADAGQLYAEIFEETRGAVCAPVTSDGTR